MKRVAPSPFADMEPAQAFAALSDRLATEPGLRRRSTLPAKLVLWRTRVGYLTLARIIQGGQVADFGRLGRYLFFIAAGIALTWGPAIAYIKYGKPSYTSHFSLILPGAGASSSINLSDIGQASSASSSAFSGSSISPTVTYKNLLMSGNVINAAASTLKVDPASLPAPVIRLVDETSLISVQMTGATAQQARDRAEAVQNAFYAELNTLRDDELRRRDDSTINAVNHYEEAVSISRAKISALQVKTGLSSSDQFSAMVAAADVQQARIAEAQAELAKIKHSKDTLSATLSISEHTAALAMKLHADPEFVALADAASKAQADYSAAAEQFGSSHPKVVDFRRRLKGVRVQLMARGRKLTGLGNEALVLNVDFSPVGQRSALLAQLVDLATQEQGLKGQIDQMSAQHAANRKKIAELVEVAANLDQLVSEHKIAEAVFASALARINTSKTDIFASYPMAQITEAAVIPLKPSSPNTTIALGAATAATVLLLFGLFLGWMRRPLLSKLLKGSATGFDETDAA